jgi:hypothetical protein
VPAKALSILEQYRREKPKHDLVFPDLEPLANLTDALAVQRYIKTRVKSNNRYLQEVLKTAKVKKTVTMHIARHSFGNIAKGKINIPTLQLLFRHTHMSTPMGIWHISTMKKRITRWMRYWVYNPYDLKNEGGEDGVEKNDRSFAHRVKLLYLRYQLPYQSPRRKPLGNHLKKDLGLRIASNCYWRVSLKR